MKSLQIAAYVQDSYAKSAYKTESYDVRVWPGLEMIRDALQRAGHVCGYCSAPTVADFDVVLVSIVSAYDWYSFVAERVSWPKGDYKTIIGGPGVDNVLPFLEYGDVFVFGRGEDLIVPLVEAIAAGDQLDDPAICYSHDFDPDGQYQYRQAERPYPYTYQLANGKPYREIAIGCDRKCLFCQYSWTRRNMGGAQKFASSRTATVASAEESTIFELDLDRPDSWPGSSMLIGCDGLSERLRRMVNKPISRDMLVALFAGTLRRTAPLYKIRVMNIIGYPTETLDDWHEMRSTWESVFDSFVEYKGDPMHDASTRIDITHTPFKPMPCTPAAVWPARYEDYRESAITRLQAAHCALGTFKRRLFNSDTVTVSSAFGPEGLSTITLWLLAVRGELRDASLFRQLSTSRAFWSSSGNVRRATLEKYLDIDRLFGVYTWSTLPTRYLHTYIKREAIERASTRSLLRHGGSAGAKLASQIAGES